MRAFSSLFSAGMTTRFFLAKGKKKESPFSFHHGFPSPRTTPALFLAVGTLFEVVRGAPFPATLGVALSSSLFPFAAAEHAGGSFFPPGGVKWFPLFPVLPFFLPPRITTMRSSMSLFLSLLFPNNYDPFLSLTPTHEDGTFFGLSPRTFFLFTRRGARSTFFFPLRERIWYLFFLLPLPLPED